MYCFTALPDCAALVAPLARFCTEQRVKGTLLLAPEGINGTIAGTAIGVERVLSQIRALRGCAGLGARRSSAATMPFHRMKVRLKTEIVTMGQPGLDPLAAGHYVAPEDWNALISEPGTIVIDTRNDYEVRIGSFAGAIDPATRSFRDFPTWFREHRDTLFAGGTAPRVAMFCTGGIRCEKATAFLIAEGVADVHHLRGGILNYLETVPVADSLWQGECFVFDERVAVGHGLSPGSHALCRACRAPLSAADRASGLYVEGVSCAACHGARDDSQRAGYAERHRQTGLAAARGEAHVGAVLPVRPAAA
ncbi:rhodanese-related sulfurtransferase [Sphingosinicellaceae bacterium]|nr:rhodanese-related sulfurtransferase [Sphingosinicellaceae bacterium]